MIGVLQRLKNLIPMNAKLRIYKTAVLPHLTYCSLVWHFCRASDRNKLERINERGLRTVFKDRVSPYGDLLTHAGMTSLYNMRLQDIAIFMFKIRNRLLPYNILELFSSSPSNYNLRNSDFHVQRVKTVKYGKHSLRFFGPFLWSKLSMKDRNETSLSRFKANIRRKDLSKLVSDNACKGCHLCYS